VLKDFSRWRKGERERRRKVGVTAGAKLTGAVVRLAVKRRNGIRDLKLVAISKVE
jgi:hypothetical protein